ncbi:sirohydrochlorin chelatase [Paraliobacillus sp. X-1268]|uniref:sirohydrochlorin chelatase n=1 Tax=Paraliobacillus sp. X-1268 TaxID=2213193 RepID=UPI000E3E3F28|nr:CbiX/SirB N-terminal domain-containing protein [Paraliobacillus sp. X-1268]
MRAVLYICHGSKNDQTNKQFQLELEQMEQYINAPIQITAFLEAEPSIIEGVTKCSEQGATEIILVPIFLLPGVHVIKDIPNEVKIAQRTFPEIPIHLGEPLGAREQLILNTQKRIVNKRLKGKQKREAVLLVSHGSRYLEASNTFTYFARELENRLLELPVFESYLNSNKPNFESELRRLLAADYEVIYLVPHFFSIGFFPEKIKQTASYVQGNQEQTEVIYVDPITFDQDIYANIKTNYNRTIIR